MQRIDGPVRITSKWFAALVRKQFTAIGLWLSIKKKRTSHRYGIGSSFGACLLLGDNEVMAYVLIKCNRQCLTWPGWAAFKWCHYLGDYHHGNDARHSIHWLHSSSISSSKPWILKWAHTKLRWQMINLEAHVQMCAKLRSVPCKIFTIPNKLSWLPTRAQSTPRWRVLYDRLGLCILANRLWRAEKLQFGATNSVLDRWHVCSQAIEPD